MADEIRTERLVLRRWRAGDRPPFARMNADPAVTRYLGHPPLSRADSDALVDRLEAHWADWGYGLWVVEAVGDGVFLGFTGLSHHRWYPDDVEVGWRLDPACWGRGLATEAAGAALGDGFERLGLERVISVIHRDNAASRRVAEKCGLRLCREEWMGWADERATPLLPIVVYEMRRPRPTDG